MNSVPAKVLVVEDENIVALDLRASLSRLGYEVTDAVATGERALESVRRRRPDLVLMDVRLRGAMDGVDAAAQLRPLDIPVIFLTAFSDDPTLRRAKLTEPLGYLLKPFDERELHIAIEMAIHRHRAQKEHEQLMREQAARAALEKEHRWTRFLADAGRKLSSSLDISVTLETVARVAVPELADWAAVHAPKGDGFETLTVRHVHGKEQLVRDVVELFPPRRDLPYGFPEVIRTGRAQLLAEVGDDVLRTAARNEEHLALLRSMHVRSLLCVPLRVRNVINGALTLASAESDRRYGPDDLAHAEELAERCAIALDNARLYQRAQAAIATREEFLSIASHELRTPLSSIQLTMQSLERFGGAIDSEQVKVKLQRARRQLGRLVKLVESLLDVSRITAGRLEIELEDVDLVELLHAIVEQFADAARQARCELTLQAPEKLQVRCDRLRIEQVAANLLSNSFKFAAGKPVEVSLARVESMIRLMVRDHGIGVPEDRLPHIFERFERAVPARQYGGLGLGLYITRQIVQAHGGSVSVEQTPGGGATFIVELPASGTSGGAANTHG
jgi:signal transduction histidine kinase/DNA-binding NarL/FixJ family response regulator